MNGIVHKTRDGAERADRAFVGEGLVSAWHVREALARGVNSPNELPKLGSRFTFAYAHEQAKSSWTFWRFGMSLILYK